MSNDAGAQVRAWKLEEERRYQDATIETIEYLGGHERIPKIVEWWEAGTLTGEALNRLIAEHWDAFESPGRFMPADEWLGLFDDAGFVTDTAGVTRPEAPLTVYRGAHKGGELGLSWTTDRNAAAWFARRFLMLADKLGAAFLLSARVPPWAVLGIFNGRNKAEVVIDASCLEPSQIHAIEATHPEVELAALGHRIPEEPDARKRVQDRREELKAILREPTWGKG